MAAKNNGRSKIAPLSVRMSPAERTEARRKAALLKVPESGFMRIAAAAYDADAEVERRTHHVEREDASPGPVAEALA